MLLVVSVILLGVILLVQAAGSISSTAVEILAGIAIILALLHAIGYGSGYTFRNRHW